MVVARGQPGGDLPEVRGSPRKGRPTRRQPHCCAVPARIAITTGKLAEGLPTSETYRFTRGQPGSQKMPLAAACVQRLNHRPAVWCSHGGVREGESSRSRHGRTGSCGARHGRQGQRIAQLGADYADFPRASRRQPALLRPLHDALAGHGYRTVLFTDRGEQPVELDPLLDGSLDGVVLTTSERTSSLPGDRNQGHGHQLPEAIPELVLDDRSPRLRAVLASLARAQQSNTDQQTSFCSRWCEVGCRSPDRAPDGTRRAPAASCWSPG